MDLLESPTQRIRFVSNSGTEFWTIFTPHWQDETAERGSRADLVRFRRLIPTIFDKSPKDQKAGSHFGSSFIYWRKTWNSAPDRRRWELELISTTPDDHFHTRQHQEAVYIDLPQ